MKNILVTGAHGQIGRELVEILRTRHGADQVWATDLQTEAQSGTGPYNVLDVTDGDRLAGLVEAYEIDTIFHLASLLSATGERKPDLAWSVNLEGLKHVLDIAKARQLKVFWPSSIAVFGPNTPKARAPQTTILDPDTMYGITKVSGELLCRYYHTRFGVDVRSVRYPGLISYKAQPGGGTTDYAVHIFYAALEQGHYTCFVGPETRLPMMYMPDALRATLDLMEADASSIRVRTSYNLGAVSFSVPELVAAIRQHVPDFVCRYELDHRHQIAASWPADVDDTSARRDWGWAPTYDLPALVEDMFMHLKQRLAVPEP